MVVFGNDDYHFACFDGRIDGVFFALGNLLDKDITADDLKHGYRAEGLAVILGGVFNTFPYTTFSQNVGLLELSGIKTKRPIYWSAVLLMLMGLCQKSVRLRRLFRHLFWVGRCW